MQLLFKQMPGYRINEYLLVLNPHEELRNKIHAIQKQFSEKYHTPISLPARPNIPLVKFTQYELMEERLINNLKLVAMGFHPIKVELSNYNCFPPHTIYINVTTKILVHDLVKEIRKETHRLMKMNEDIKPHFFTEAYVPIARNLQPAQFTQAWCEFSHRHFTGKFIADGMLLLKRKQGNLGYEIMQRFQFENLFIPVVKQGDLFS